MSKLLKLALAAVMAMMLAGAFCSAAVAQSRIYVDGSVGLVHYYGPYYGPWHDPWYPRGYYYAPPDYGWLWTQVEPNTAEVWVDGKLFGLVREFDGPVNHLRLPLGSHEAVFRHPDYETYTAGFYIYPGETTTINYDMRPLSGVKPERGGGEFGTILIDVSPGGAQISVDGKYSATSTDEGGEIVISAPPGRRQITVTREGYRDYFTEAEVVPGRKIRISVRLKVSQSNQ